MCFDLVSLVREKYNSEWSDTVGTNRVLYHMFGLMAKRGELNVPVRFIPVFIRI